MRTLAGKTTKFGKLLLEAARADTTGRGGLAVLGAAAAVAAAADDTGELVQVGRRTGQAAAAAAGDTGWGAMPANHGELTQAGQPPPKENQKRASCLNPGGYRNRQACRECEVCTAASNKQRRMWKG